MKLHSKYKNMLGFSIQRQKPFTLPLLIPQIFGALQRTHMSLLYSIKACTQNPTNCSQLTKHMIYRCFFPLT